LNTKPEEVGKQHCHQYDDSFGKAANYFDEKQGITNTLAMPIDNMLYIYSLCPHSKHHKNPF
jgi:hypothetical protein